MLPCIFLKRIKRLQSPTQLGDTKWMLSDKRSLQVWHRGSGSRYKRIRSGEEVGTLCHRPVDRRRSQLEAGSAGGEKYFRKEC